MKLRWGISVWGGYCKPMDQDCHKSIHSCFSTVYNIYDPLHPLCPCYTTFFLSPRCYWLSALPSQVPYIFCIAGGVLLRWPDPCRLPHASLALLFHNASYVTPYILCVQFRGALQPFGRVDKVDSGRRHGTFGKLRICDATTRLSSGGRCLLLRVRCRPTKIPNQAKAWSFEKSPGNVLTFLRSRHCGASWITSKLDVVYLPQPQRLDNMAMERNLVSLVFSQCFCLLFIVFSLLFDGLCHASLLSIVFGRFCNVLHSFCWFFIIVHCFCLVIVFPLFLLILDCVSLLLLACPRFLLAFAYILFFLCFC